MARTRRAPRFAILLAAATLGATVVVGEDDARADDGNAATMAPADVAPADGFSVREAVVAMRRGHPLLRAAAANVSAADADAVSAGHWSNPTVDASYEQAVRNTSYDRAGLVAIGVTQFLETAGAPAARRRSADASAKAARGDQASIALTLEWDVEEAFVHASAARARASIWRDAEDDVANVERVARARVGAGVAPHYDASRAHLALGRARADRADAEAAIVRTRAALDIAVGPAAGDLRGAPREDADADVLPPLDALRLRLGGRPDLAAANARAASASIDVDVAKRSVFPGFGVRLGGDFGQAPGQADVGLGIVVPLPLFERGQGAIPAANARAEAARSTAEAARVAAIRALDGAYAEYVLRVAARDRFTADGATFADLRAEADASYREARASILELLDAHAAYRDARLRAIDLAETAAVARITVCRAAGIDGT